MSIFDRQGLKIDARGCGGNPCQIDNFTLNQGIAAAQFTHHGEGDFKLKLAARRQRGFIGKAGRFTKIAGSGDWNIADANGPLQAYAVTRVHKKGDRKISPGEYSIEAEAQGEWSCRIIQPDLGQALAALTDANIGGDGENEGPSYILGPYTSGDRPIIAEIRHYGIGNLNACAYSLDGTHQCLIYREQGQFYVQDVHTEIRPGKEYLLFVDSPDGWNIAFSEGY